MKTLVIKWNKQNNETCDLYLWDESQHITWEKQNISLTSINETIKSRNAKNTKIVVIIPGQLVTLTEVTLPKNISKKQRQKMIGYAVEEEIIDDPDSLHFVLGEPINDPEAKTSNKQHRYPLAIIAKNKISAITEQLEQQNIFADVMIPDFFAIKAPETNTHLENNSTWNASIIDDQAMIRISHTQGYTVNSTDLPWFCEQILQQENKEDERPVVNLLLCNNNTSLPWTWQEKLQKKINLQSKNDCPLEQCWSIDAITSPSTNLLTGAYRSKGKHQKTSTSTSTSTKIWKYCIYTAIILVAVAFASKGARYFILSSQNKVFSQQINQQAQRYLPQRDNSNIEVSQIKNKIRNVLTQIKKLDHHNQVLEQLTSLDNFFSAHKQCKVISLSYNTNKWQAEISSDSLSSLRNITNYLGNDNWKVQQKINTGDSNKSANIEQQATGQKSKNYIYATLILQR